MGEPHWQSTDVTAIQSHRTRYKFSSVKWAIYYYCDCTKGNGWTVGITDWQNFVLGQLTHSNSLIFPLGKMNFKEMKWLT